MDPYAPLRSRDLRFLLTGTFLSSFGLQMIWVAASWDLYQKTHSAFVLGNVGFVQVAPFVFLALVAGHIADRYDRRKILAGMQIPLVVSSAILVFAGASVGLIYFCLFLNACARALQSPSRQAILPHVVELDQLRTAITWNSTAQEIATVTGPALAGALIAFSGTRSVYISQLVCTVLSLVCFYSIRPREGGIAVSPQQEERSLLEGVRFVRDNKLVLAALSLDLFAVLFGGATALLPIYAVDILHVGAHGLGWLRAAPSVGAVAMALTQTHLPKIRNAGRALLWAVAGFGIATIVFGISRSLPLSIAMLVLTGAFDNISVVFRSSLVQVETPDYLRGRVFAVNAIFISCSNQLGAVESGWTAAWFGAVPSVVGGGVATVLIVLGFSALASQLRRWQQ
ncbi:MFS transporter [Nevskia soli]|uniref:MFS transporter n=1 Tax=Nevskia soli TaxID=418856 RepID=UPI0015D952D3|nr:MFS transporter [Nevskia soli]